MKFHRSVIAATLTFSAATLVSAGSLSAHCQLDSPNGGEVLRIGSTFTIEWTETASHNVVNWDLYYSTTGSSGPWIPIVLNLPPASRSYAWNVQIPPATASTTVRVKVVQDMLSFFYDDISDQNLSIVPSLTTNKPTLSLSAGGTQRLTVDVGSSNAGLPYLVVGSYTGTSPGVTLGGVPIPVNVDSYFFSTITGPNVGPLLNSLGTLSANGRATAQFVLPPGLPPGLAGLQLHHAVIVFTSTPTITMATNPVGLSFGT